MHHTKTKGDLALAKVIADLTEKNFSVFLPMSEHLPFDLIAYDSGKSHRIQVKYSRDGVIKDNCSWADKNGTHKRKYGLDDFDYFGVYLPELNLVVYPSIKFMGCTIRTEQPKSSVPFYWYEDFLKLTDDAEKKSYRDFGISLSPRFGNKKVVWPTKEELDKLILTMPIVDIATKYGVSDKAVAKWVKQYGLKKPKRGYWQKTSRCPVSVMASPAELELGLRNPDWLGSTPPGATLQRE